jgi:hypothetical protein
MPSALLLDIRNDRHYTGDTRLELVQATGRVTFDLISRKARIDGRVVSQYSDEYSADELLKEMARDVVKIFVTNYGFQLFIAKD